MADEKEALTESQKQTDAGNALETRRLRKMAAEQQQERRAWLFNNLTDEEREEIISDLQEISTEYECLFEEFVEERDFEMAGALKSAIEKHGYHYVLAALDISLDDQPG